MVELMTYKDIEKYQDNLTKYKYQCKCGHKVVIPEWETKQVCHWCKRYVFKSKKDEDLYRIKEKMKNE